MQDSAQTVTYSDFILPDTERPELAKSRKTQSGSVPTIDLSAYLTGSLSSSEELELAEKWREACKSVGFAYIRGWESVMPADVIARAFDFSERFFSLPYEEKDHLRYTSEAANRGQKETFEIGNDAMPQYPEHWPEEDRLGLTGFRETFKAFHANGHVLQSKLMALIALSLGLPKDYFEAGINEKPNHLRLLHYPVQTSHESVAHGSRFHAHTDIGTLTCLWQDDVGGLEVKPPGGSWVTVPPQEGTFLINCGDILKLWTNDQVSSTVHRTALPEVGEQAVGGIVAARRSIAFFGNPNPSAIITPISGFGEPKYKPFVAQDFYRARLGAPVKVN
ncbi:oxidoreductase,Oxoglutarate/iron-dependent oxygenase family [Pseudohyphozyma bogoriensis]|nr:oxidoreductase,Oxoglutarate/iron-dependent oxygenase family [Pseudohyphozyma bogoriensis]